MNWPEHVPQELKQFAESTGLDLSDCRQLNLGSEDAARGVQLDPDDAGMGAPPSFSDATPPNWMVELRSEEGENYQVQQRQRKIQITDTRMQERFNTLAPYRLRKLATKLAQRGYRLASWTPSSKRDHRFILEFQSTSGDIFEMCTNNVR